MDIQNPADQIKEYADEKGVSVNAACKRAGVARTTVHRWSKNEPETIKNMRLLKAAIDELAEQNNAD